MNQPLDLVLAAQCIMLGAKMEIFYDGIRVVQNVFDWKMGLVFLSELTYWIFVTFYFYDFLLENNQGDVRVYLIIAVFSGMILWEIGLGRTIVCMLSDGLRKAWNMLRLFLKKVRHLLNLVLKKIQKPFRIVLTVIRKKIVRNIKTKKGKKKLRELQNGEEYEQPQGAKSKKKKQ